ncbi:hypothetical protein [Promicromonospora sp. NPDC050249]|uniref:hypothetical protein n=1 Tax=Promicromonospora sp. NPDC050249 TaxID=3154743 RepID=UPI003401F085
MPVRADYDDAGSLLAALRGVDVLVFVSGDGEAARMLVQHENVVRAASACGERAGRPGLPGRRRAVPGCARAVAAERSAP